MRKQKPGLKDLGQAGPTGLTPETRKKPWYPSESFAELEQRGLQVALQSRATARLHSPLTRQGGGPREMCAFIQ